ncbi:hypothetical protein EV356DRAFT_507574 [Viridothelium virens]|uniref:Uncharacterized protein n=1 Tax=Viridothelium virens TaxID=1048519 RepID=A0A6A6HKU5_VIRVR|nr:hypothetical protein EV356DRAFT_507574 [Viridothelium virens]
MSVTSTDVAQPRTNNTSATFQTASGISEDLQSLDALVDRIAKHIPEMPYVPSIPQDERKAYPNSYQTLRAWSYETPFNEDEHPNLQYMTFLYQDPTDSCIQLHSMGEYDRSKQNQKPTSTVNGIQSGTNTPSQSTAPKKKMTFGDYKKKQINGGLGALAQQPAQDMRINRDQASKDPNNDENSSKNVMDQAAGTAEAKPERKHTPLGEPRQDSPPPAKRRKTSPPPAVITNAQDTQPAPVPRDPQDLPSSPVSMDIPSIPVSLDLPSFVTNELFAVDRQKPSPDQSPTPSKVLVSTKNEAQRGAKRTDSPLQVQANGSHGHQQLANEIEREPVGSVGRHSHAHPAKKSESLTRGHQDETSLTAAKVAGTSQSRVGGESSGKATKNGSPPILSAKNSGASQNHAHPQKAKPIAEPRENRPRMRKIIKLKIGKRNRKTLANYLRFPPTPWSTEKLDQMLGRESEGHKEAGKPNGTTINGVRTARERSTTLESSSKPPEKRPRPNEEWNVQERANKRLKVPSSLELQNESGTPEAPPSKSPTSNLASVQKHVQSTPRNNLKSVAMQRIGSTESAYTPHSSVQTPPISGFSEQITPKKDPSKDNEKQAWRAETARLSKMGKDLKHNAENKDGRGEKNAKLAAVKMLESFMCFLLAFVCTDNLERVCNQAPDLKDNNWLSLQKFSQSAVDWAKPYPHLYGLGQQLVTVLDSHIATLATRVPSSHWPTPLTLADAMVHLQRAAASGAHRLPIQELTEKYPQTCKKAAAYITRVDHGKPNDYAGEYAVPLNLQSTPLQAVRFGVVFLKEWLQLEKLSYNLELKLSS